MEHSTLFTPTWGPGGGAYPLSRGVGLAPWSPAPQPDREPWQGRAQGPRLSAWLAIWAQQSSVDVHGLWPILSDYFAERVYPFLCGTSVFCVCPVVPEAVSLYLDQRWLP